MKCRTLTTIGLPIRLEVLIKSHLKLVNARTIDHWSFSDERQTDLAICDPDSPLSAVTVRRSREHGAPLCVSLVDSNRQPLPGTIALHDPIRVSDVIDLLDRVSGGLKASSAGDPASPSEGAAIAPPGSHRLRFTRVLQALVNMGSDDPHLIEAGPLRFCLLPLSRILLLSEPLTETWLERILGLDLELTATAIPAASQAQILPAFRHRAPLIKLLWHVGLNVEQTPYTGIRAEEAAFTLNRWPDFGNLKHKPVHLRMAAELTRKRMTLVQLAEVTHASIDQVGAFVNACAWCNLIETHPYPASSPITVRVAEPRPSTYVPHIEVPRRGVGFLHSIRLALGLRTA